MSPIGMLVQQQPGVPVQFWESVPTSVQVLVGGVALAGAGWRWFLRPRIAGMITEVVSGGKKEMTEAVSGLKKEIADARKESQEAHAAIGERIDSLTYYPPAVAGLLRAVGATLKPKVFCVLEPADQGVGHLDVYLNDEAFWRNVPSAVWNYRLGGYQVLSGPQLPAGRQVSPISPRNCEGTFG